ncbi:GDP/GTP exchange factor for ARF [Mucor circinelloides]
MVSTYSSQPFSMTADTSRSAITLPSDDNKRQNSLNNNTETRIKSELSWSQLINAEIVAVTSAMRKNARWSGMGVNGLRMGSLGNSMGLRSAQTNTKDSNTREENPLMQGFINLRTYMEAVTDVGDIDAVNLLTPFLEVIRSGSTTGPIAGTALGSVEKLLHYGIVGVHNPRVSAAMNALSSAATHCKFEASDAASDELVLLRMLQVLQMAITSECGQVLSDEAVCEMMETGLSMCCQMRLSEMLRRSAEHVMINMVIAIFERLKNLEDEWQFVESPNDGTEEPADPHMSTPKPSPSPTPQSTTENATENATEIEDAPADNVDDIQTETDTAKDNDVVVESPKSEETPEVTAVVEPTTLRAYGLPAIRELLRVLISLLNPHEHKHTDSMRLMALSILNVAFEVGGRSIGRFESLRTLITDEFCKFVFQLAKTDSTPLLAYSLRIITTVFDTLRPYLKLQQELFIFFLIERLSPTSGAGSRGVSVDVDEEGNISFVSMRNGVDSDNSVATDVRSASPNMFLGKSTDYPRNSKGYASSSEHMAITGEVRELLLESLVQFARKPTFMIDLWYNYDCDLTCGDLFEELIQFLSKNSFPDHQTYSLMSSHVLCLDTLLTFISQMMDRVENQDDVDQEDYVELTSVQDLLERKTRKRLILKGSRLFNDSPKKGIKFLVENGVIEADENGDINASLSHFLRSTQQLDKKALGEYLGRPENVETLRAYMEQFDFSGKRMDEAMRMILETFRLPGESQQIMRVTEAFAATYFASGPKEIATIDAAEVLAYSVIMLNVDQHSPQIRRQSRMSVEQYIRNVSGVNDKKDFPRDYLVSIYEAIQQNEILMPEEHEGLLGFNYAWKQLQHRSTMCGQFIQCHTSTYDKAVFELSWKPVVAAISYVFNTAQDDDTLEKAITGFRQCASLAAHFELYDVFDSIIVNLATMTGLLESANGNTSVPDPIVDIAGQKYVVSKLAVRFGRNYKGQLAAVVMFTIVTRHGDSLRKGWFKILQIIRNLFLNSLLPSSMLQVEDFLSGTTSIPLKPKSPKPVKQANRRDGSLLSTLSSYLLSPYSSDETYCRDPTDEEVESTMCAVDCIAVCKLEELFTDISTLQTDTLKCLLKAIRSVGYDTENMKKATITIAYDPATVLFLEFMITITVRNADRIEELWPYATEYIFGILEFADKQSVLVVERTVVGLLRLCICSAARNVMLDEIVKCLRLLRDFPPTVTQAVAEQMMAGIFNLSSANSENRNDTEFLNTILEIKQKVANSL